MCCSFGKSAQHPHISSVASARGHKEGTKRGETGKRGALWKLTILQLCLSSISCTVLQPISSLQLSVDVSVYKVGDGITNEAQR
jgi:hypothetical protein